ncbi:MAG: hypothetical protein LBD01_01815 [Puniceicoccales bacterium]|jgi:hypothetical protein|nr:hypothetical protein [Puniceicoccales bacterium]
MDSFISSVPDIIEQLYEELLKVIVPLVLMGLTAVVGFGVDFRRKKKEEEAAEALAGSPPSAWREALRRPEPDPAIAPHLTPAIPGKIFVDQTERDKVLETIQRTKQAMSVASSVPLLSPPPPLPAAPTHPTKIAPNLRSILRNRNALRTAFLAHEFFSPPLSLRRFAEPRQTQPSMEKNA